MSTIRVDNFGPSAGGTTYSARGIAKAWVNFNGTGTIAARDSENVSSLTDNGTGTYTTEFTSAMGDANYSAVVGGKLPVATNDAGEFYASVARSDVYSATAVRIQTTGNSSVTARDAEICNMIIHGDLA